MPICRAPRSLCFKRTHQSISKTILNVSTALISQRVLILQTHAQLPDSPERACIGQGGHSLNRLSNHYQTQIGSDRLGDELSRDHRSILKKPTPKSCRTKRQQQPFMLSYQDSTKKVMTRRYCFNWLNALPTPFSKQGSSSMSVIQWSADDAKICFFGTNIAD